MKYSLSNSIDKQKAQMRFKQLLEDEMNIELKEVRKSRTIKQNAYLHVCITLFAVEFGYTIEESKTHLKRECDFMRYEKEKEVFLKRTRDLNTKDLTDFVDWIRNYASQMDCYIPSADEYLENRFSIDKEIDQHKQYL